MTQFMNNAHDSESSSQYANIRLAGLADQRWNRNKSVNLASATDVSFGTSY